LGELLAFSDRKTVSDTSLQSGFRVNIIVNVAKVPDLYSYEFKLNWTGSMLNVTKVVEGPFLKSEGSTFFIPIMNNTGNYVSVVSTLFMAPARVHGNGTLAIIEFLVEDYGSTILQLYETLLEDSQPFTPPIGHAIGDGYFDNTLAGDSYMDAGHDVDYDDFILLAGNYGKNV